MVGNEVIYTLISGIGRDHFLPHPSHFIVVVQFLI